MSTKSDNCLSFSKDKQKLDFEPTNHHSNLNLNQNNLHSHDVNFVSSKSVTTTTAIKNTKSNYGTAALTSLLTDNFSVSKTNNSFLSWNKSTKNNFESSKIFDNSVKEKNSNKAINNSNSSTLSLHISAYENSSSANAISASDTVKENGTNKKGKNAKQILINSTSNIQNPFEVPRQQENEVQDSEISQFKASQKLLNPRNSNSVQHGIITHIVQQNDNQFNLQPPLGFGASNDNVFGSEQALLERFSISNTEGDQFERSKSELRTKKFIIELLHLHWYHETNRIVVTESRIANGYKLANELLAKNELQAQQFLEASKKQKEKIIELQNQLETERRKYRALENQYKLFKPDAEKIPSPTLDISGLNGLFSITLLNTPDDEEKPCYKTCAFGELDEGGPIFDERDESLRPHQSGGWHHPQISPLIDEPLNERRKIPNIDSETISNTGLNYDVMLNCSTATAARELEHPAAKIGRKLN